MPAPLLHEENFYTFKYDLIDPELLADLVAVHSGGNNIVQPVAHRSLAVSMLLGRDQNGFPQGPPGHPPISTGEPPVFDPGTGAAAEPPVRVQQKKVAAQHWLNAAAYWSEGILKYARENDRSRALKCFEACQLEGLSYFEKLYDKRASGTTVSEKLADVANLFGGSALIDSEGAQILRAKIQNRAAIASTAELHNADWSWGARVLSWLALRAMLIGGRRSPLTSDHYPAGLDLPMLALICVRVPLAQADIESSLRRPERAVAILKDVFAGERAKLLNAAIEEPFARIALAVAHMELGDQLYRAERRAEAREMYRAAVSCLRDSPSLETYVRSATVGYTQLRSAVSSGGALELEAISTNLYVPGFDIVPRPGSHGAEVELLRRTLGPSPVISPSSSNSDTTNSRVLSLLFQLLSREQQLEAKFNFLGYPDDYTPPWRFQVLLDRARYFAEHAKQAQRDYLNFLSSAEREDLQERSAVQTVAMEGVNISIEGARVQQAGAEALVTMRSLALAGVVADHARDRLTDYVSFDQEMDRIFYVDAANAAHDAAEAVADYGTPTGLLLYGADKLGIPGASTARDIYKGILTGIGDFFSGGAASRTKQTIADNLQRGMEIRNLQSAKIEAQHSAAIATAQVGVAEAAFVVAKLQQQAALLRHSFAIEIAEYLATRTLNAEQWYRLATHVRAIADTYLRYAIEVAFLAEQAYEFEADKRLDIIRFDYDLSEMGDYLAGDFLLRDLDTLEHDLIVTQRERQQHVRYVLSMARELPATLQDLRDDGHVTFSVVLEQIERRFPGLINAKLGAVDVLPIALMDPSRFSLRLTQQGVSSTRVRPGQGVDIVRSDGAVTIYTNGARVIGRPATSGLLGSQVGIANPIRILNFKVEGFTDTFALGQVHSIAGMGTLDVRVDGNFRFVAIAGHIGRFPKVTCATIGGSGASTLDIYFSKAWPTRFQVRGPETAIYSGLSRQDAANVFPVATSGQRNAFEGRGAAGAWEIDMSMDDNQVVPGSLADVLITFNIAGYYDAHVVTEPRPTGPNVITSYLSARQTFPDSFFEFSRSGIMNWPVTANLLTVAGRVGRVRNAGVLVVPANAKYQYRRFACSGLVDVTLDTNGLPRVVPGTEPPQVAFSYPDSNNPLKILAAATLSDAEFRWDAGDGVGKGDSSMFEYAYNRPGTYEMTLQVIRAERFREYKVEVVVARDTSLALPVSIAPKVSFAASTSNGMFGLKTEPSASASDLSVSWQLLGHPKARRARTASQPLNEEFFDLPDSSKGRTVQLAFRAVLGEQVGFYCRQLYRPDARLPMRGLNVASNRRFRDDGTRDQDAQANPTAMHLFGNPPNAAFGAVDTWTFGLPASRNGGTLASAFSGHETSKGREDPSEIAWQFDGSQIEDLILTLEYEVD